MCSSALAAHSLTPERSLEVMTIAVIESEHFALHFALCLSCCLLSWNDEKTDDGVAL